MITKPSGSGHRKELERERVHTLIARAWKANGRHMWSDAEINAAVDAEMEKRYPPKAKQTDLPGMPAESGKTKSIEPSTKAESLDAHLRNTAAQRRVQIYDLLDRAGSRGMTREELAESLGVRPSDVCHEVNQLVTSREACQPFRRLSSAHRKVWVVVLAKHHRGQA